MPRLPLWYLKRALDGISYLFPQFLGFKGLVKSVHRLVMYGPSRLAGRERSSLSVTFICFGFEDFRIFWIIIPDFCPFEFVVNRVVFVLKALLPHTGELMSPFRVGSSMARGGENFSV